MTDEIKKRQQQEWIQTVTLTQEQVQRIISDKLVRGRAYAASVRLKSSSHTLVCDKCQTEII